MPKKTVLFFLLLYCFSAAAQKADTSVYYIKEQAFGIVPVTIKDSADFYRVIISPDTSVDKQLFIVDDFYKNGKPKMVGNSINQGYSVRLSGVCIEFFENGHRKSVKNYADNRLTGDVVEYYPNGKIYFTGKYKENSKLILMESRDSTGKILATDGNGHHIKYSPDFKNVIEEGEISNGQENGEWHGRLNDSINYICNYNSGIIKNGISYDNRGNKYPFTYPRLEPQFPGGETAFIKFLEQNIHYPNIAKQNNVQGRVFIGFIVEKNGALTHFNMLRIIGSGCDDEALRVLKQSPKWTPGASYGVPVRVAYTIPVTFSLSRN